MYQENKSLYKLSKYLFVSILLLMPVVSSAQDSVNLTSPYFTVYTHLDNLQEDNYFPEVAARTLHPSIQDDRQELAIKLKQVLDGSGIIIDMDELPRNQDYYDSASSKYRYYLTDKYPDLYLEKSGDKWYYSEKSVRKITSWHKEVFPFGIDRLLNVLPKIGTRSFLGLHIWQLVGILLLIISAFILHLVFSFLFERLIYQVLVRFGYKELAHNVVMPIAKPISFLVIFPLLILFVPVLQLPIILNKYVILILRAVWPIFAIVFFYRLVDVISMYFSRLAERTESTLDDQLVPLLRKVLKTFVVIVGGIFILDNLEFDITGLLAGISIGGLAFALAAQDTIKNFFGSLMIFVDRPFQVGDWITSGDVDGTVEEVGFRSTRIRTFRDSLMYIPNGLITNQTIDNHGLRKYRRFMTRISVTYDTPPDLIEVFVEGLKKLVDQHPETRKDYYQIHFNDMGASSLDILFYIFFDVPTWTDELRGRHEILLSVVRLADELGINFAFPTQTLHVETFPEKLGNSPRYGNSKEELRKKLDDFFRESSE
ncbi:mechanosensitive ion channel family protein [Fulvivirga sedimenti]|uniref:Mechanosensitive ion channel n=1 Tax=Fulvivirga sedimenti TaxID=2879465 RepID=A0A9X1L297_9BACT|nr:mechanosensitive ion channel domain-containing protein [Fulvivirga sedimenti]MCA6079067.1 mechanosensitive ion channel [Fulvivirga sedimenti]